MAVLIAAGLHVRTPAGEPGNASQVVINEFVASNRGSLIDGDGNTPDWIELYNVGTEPISVSGWYLTDQRNDLFKWPFPRETVLPAHGYLVVCASGRSTDGYVDGKGYLHTNFALDREGEYLALIDSSGQVLHEYAPRFPLQRTDVSYGMWQGTPRYFAVPTPGRANERPALGLTDATQHSDERGFHNEPFDLWIYCDTPGASIRYTLDGSEPADERGIPYTLGTPIPIATTTVVRSVAFQSDWIPTDVTTHTYIFVDDVARQGPDPLGWPSDWGYDSEVGGIVPADYEMDPRVTNNTQSGYSVSEALLDIPTVSISMLPEDFIGEADGIYTNPLRRWERKCSVEYILPDASPGFQHDCKIEIHGNSSRRPWRMQKHSFRLTFTSQYGPAKLEYPLFPDSEVEEFNQLVLRACFTDSWGLVSWTPPRYRPNDSQYLRDIWMKESLRDMGQPSSHGYFVHLYVNGLYFGMYNLTERIGEDFLAAHLGGRPEDWEINEDYSTPGSHWRAMMSVDPATLAGYMEMQEYLDVENFADYMVLHFYADAEDWPQHNGYAAANAASGDGRFRFFVWDQEIVLDHHGRAASRIDSTGGAGSLFQKMRASEEFRLLFADRVFRHCFQGGALSVTASQKRYLDLARWVNRAIVAESARWGDTQMSTPYGNTIEQPNPLTNSHHDLYPPVPNGPDYYFTREGSWIVERDNILDNYIPAIHDTANAYALINILRARHLYPDIDPPLFDLAEGDPHDSPIGSGTFRIMNPNGTGMVYYTIDGTDPRTPGVGPRQDGGKILIGEGAAKRVLVPTEDIRQAWIGARPYDDTGWIAGIGGVGYEKDADQEPLFDIDVEQQMYGANASCYIRIPFVVAGTDLSELTWLILRVRYDDGFVAYVNGVEVARDSFAGIPQWNSVADGSHPDSEAASFVDFDITPHVDRLRPGDNILAVHGLNVSPTSSDFLISMELVGGDEGDSQAGPNTSPAAAKYVGAIDLTEDMHVKARVWDGRQWSALNEFTWPEPLPGADRSSR